MSIERFDMPTLEQVKEIHGVDDETAQKICDVLSRKVTPAETA